MKGNVPFFWIDKRNCNDQIFYGFDSFNNSIPVNRIYAISNDKFIYSKMLVCAVPVHIGLLMKISSDFPLILSKNGVPKRLYIHFTSPLSFHLLLCLRQL